MGSPTAGTLSGMQVEGCAGPPKFVHRAIFFDLLVSAQRLFTLSPLMGLISCVVLDINQLGIELLLEQSCLQWQFVVAMSL